MKNKTINVKGTEITIIVKGKEDFISLTDMVKGFGDDTMIYSWLRNRNTLEFIGIWEEMYNPDFKGNEFVTFKTRIVQFFPYSKKFNGITVSHPAIYHRIITKMFYHVGERNIIIVILFYDSDRSPFHHNLFVLSHNRNRLPAASRQLFDH